MEAAAASFKVIILGSSSVGKTALISRLSTGEFRSNTVATIGIDFHTYSVQLDNGVVVSLQIWDTAGQERFRNITKNYYRGAHGVIYVYDVTNPSSFQDLGYWLDSVTNNVSSDQIRARVSILLGNKKDLEDAKMIQKKDAEMLRDRNTLYGFYEVSAKTGENVEKAFKDLAFYLVDNYNQELLKPVVQRSKVEVEVADRTVKKPSVADVTKKPGNPFATNNSTETTIKLRSGAPPSKQQSSCNTVFKCT